MLTAHRIYFAFWKESKPYDRNRYQAALLKHGTFLLSNNPKP